MKNLSIRLTMALLAALSVQIGASAGKLADDPYPSCDRAGCVVSSAVKLADDPYPSCDRAGCVVSSAVKLADDPYPSCDRAGCVVG